MAKAVIATGEIRTLCRQCDMHCGIRVLIRDSNIARISGDPCNPQNQGRICPKAPAAKELLEAPDRLSSPLKRRPDGSFAEIGYTQAIDEIAATLTTIADASGKRAVGVWTGEAVGFQQQADYARRFVHAFGSPNYFSAESVCFASRYIAFRLVQGFYNPFADFENARLILFWGINPGVTHLPYMLAVRAARARGARLVVIDPRRSEAAREADLFVQIQPGADGALAWGLANRLIAWEAYDKAFVRNYGSGFEAFRAHAEGFTPERVESLTGVTRETADIVAKLIATHRPRVIQSPGISLEHQVNGVDTLRTIACLTGLTGAVDTVGGEKWADPPSLRRLNLYDELPLGAEKPIGADRFPVLYNLRRECHSLTAMDCMLGRGEAPLRGLIVTGANPVLTNPNTRKVTHALQSLDLLVVRDLFLTPTARLAHYVLPAASFLERSELHIFDQSQRIALTNKVLDNRDVTDEYAFWRDLAHRLGKPGRYFPWEDEEEVNRWLLEPSGLSLEALKAHPEGLRYAVYTPEKFRTRPLPTPSGKFEFSSRYLEETGYDPVPVCRPSDRLQEKDPNFPFVLITGARKSFYYHSRYRNIARFRKAFGAPEVEIHPKDADRLHVRSGDQVRVVSAVGSLEIQARVTAAEAILPGVLQITHGWEAANVNLLTDDRQVDRVSGLPNMRRVAVRVEKK